MPTSCTVGVITRGMENIRRTQVADPGTDSLIDYLSLSLRSQVLRWVHGSNLTSPPWTNPTVFTNRYFWWPTITPDVKECVCLSHLSKSNFVIFNQQPLSIPRNPWSHISNYFITCLKVTLLYSILLTDFLRQLIFYLFLSYSQLQKWLRHWYKASMVFHRMQYLIQNHNLHQKSGTLQHPLNFGQSPSWLSPTVDWANCNNQQLESTLRCLINNNPSTWISRLTWVEYAHNPLIKVIILLLAHSFWTLTSSVVFTTSTLWNVWGIQVVVCLFPLIPSLSQSKGWVGVLGSVPGIPADYSSSYLRLSHVRILRWIDSLLVICSPSLCHLFTWRIVANEFTFCFMLAGSLFSSWILVTVIFSVSLPQPSLYPAQPVRSPHSLSQKGPSCEPLSGTKQRIQAPPLLRCSQHYPLICLPSRQIAGGPSSVLWCLSGRIKYVQGTVRPQSDWPDFMELKLSTPSFIRNIEVQKNTSGLFHSILTQGFSLRIPNLLIKSQTIFHFK